jgi:glucose/arabinose dehydrogenase
VTKAAGSAAAVLLLIGLAGCGSDGADSTPVPTPSSGAGCSGGAPVTGTPALTTQLVVRGFASPLDLQAPAGDSRIFVVEQGGRIRIVRSGAIVGQPFLDISGRISSGGEQGLLGLAFHPLYATNGRFYVNYTDPAGDSHVSEFKVSANADVADASSERALIFVKQPFANHNGGGLAFGNDGFLYAGFGDGGSGGDPLGNGQNLGTQLGKMLRIDVDHGNPFAIPPDNPFANRSGAIPSIWAYGLRNPFRFSFDRATGDLYIGDVGQDRFEEVDVGVVSRHGGENYGWNVTEASQCFQPASGCNKAGITLPVTEYGHADGCSIVGGVVYHGCRLPGYAGTYFYSDYCSAFVRSFRLVNGQATDARDWTGQLGRGLDRPTSFGTDADGEIYVVDQDGEIYKIVPAS